MNPELEEYLAIIEAKLRSLLQDIQNIRDRLTETRPPHRQLQRGAPTFFEALTADDSPRLRPRTKFEQCPHN